jgi:PAS domain S-box-containing protein
MKKAGLFLSSFLFCAFVLHAQTHKPSVSDRKIDSLLQIVKTTKADTTKVIALNFLGERYWRKGRYDTAMQCAGTAISISENLHYKKGIAGALRNIGIINYQQGDYSKALENDLKVQALEEEIGDRVGYSNNLGNIGLVYYSQGNFNKALECQEKSLLIHLQLNNKIGIANNYGNMGSIYRGKGDLIKSREFYEKSLAMHLASGNKIGVANNLGNIGNICETQGDFTKALEYHLKALATSTEVGYKNGISSNLIAIGNTYTKQKNYKQAKTYLDSALAISLKTGEKALIKDAYEGLGLLDSTLGDTKKGLLDYKKYIIYRDSLNSEAITQKTVQEEMNYEFEQKQILAKQEQNRKEIVAEQDKKQQVVIRNSLIAGFVLILIVVLLLYGRYRTKERTTRLLREQNRLIQERNTDLERLSIVARETENLILIMGPDGTVEWVNESFARLNGITLDELRRQKGNTIYEISNNPDIRNIIETAVREKRTVIYESLNLNKDGMRTWESSTLTPIFNERGELKKIIIVDTNITQRKNDEEIIQQINKDITDSIHYAKRLQDAILPPIGEIRAALPESFVLFKPKAIVAGDFYWMEHLSPASSLEGSRAAKEIQPTILLAAADCTGHGVPGALVSVVCSNALNRAVKEFGITEPGKILDKVRELVVETFEKSESSVHDGMDISLCSITPPSMPDSESSKQGMATYTIRWSGANNPLWYIQNGILREIEADKQPVGRHDKPIPFQTHSLSLCKGDSLFLFTDGYADQFGGAKGKKYKYKQLQEDLLGMNSLPSEEQKNRLETTLNVWKGNLEQVDDILVIGVRF